MNAAAGPPDPHRIRLREPWDCEIGDCEIGDLKSPPLSPAEAANAPERTLNDRPNRDVPASPGPSLAWIRFHRHFHQPTGIEPGDTVDAVFEKVQRSGEVWLNDCWLGDLPADSELVRLPLPLPLQRRNRLTVEFRFRIAEREHSAPELNASFSQFVGEVRLEVHSARP
jgi:hypothetical protein